MPRTLYAPVHQWFRHCALAVFVALAAHVGVVHAVGFDLELDVSLVAASPHAPQLPPDLLLAATWPTACLPKVERTTMTPGHIDVHLRSGTNPCVASPTRLDLRVNPASAAGWIQMPLDFYEVRLFLHQADRPAALIAFRVLDASGDIGLSKPENGFWWSVGGRDHVSVLSGSGITLERQEDRLAVTLLGYEAGNPIWYFGSTTLRNSVARVHLMRMLGGSASFDNLSTAPIAEPGPVIHLQFEAPSRAKAWLERPQSGSEHAIELRELEFQRLAFAPGRVGAAWRGRWILLRNGADFARIVALSTETSVDADSFRLGDDAAFTTLDCRITDASGHALPTSCSLSEAGSVLATFNRIGIDRMTGRAADGEQIEFVRVPD